MRQIFTNAGLAVLTQNFASSDTALYVDDVSNLPVPEPGDEFFTLTLVGACEKRIEVVRVVENTGSYLIIDERGLDGTTPDDFLVNDYAYHALTAGAVQALYDSWAWYLGAFDTAPVADNQGDPLIEGHMYYNKTTNFMFVWNGTKWRPIAGVVGGLEVGDYTWIAWGNLPGPTTLPWPDDRGQSPVDFVEGEMSIDVYLNGTKLIQDMASSPDVDGDYTVDYANDTITILYNMQEFDTIEASVLLRADADSLDYIRRDETDTTDFGFVVADGETTLTPDQQLPTIAYVDSRISAVVDPAVLNQLSWGGKWAAGTYEKNVIVTDNDWLTVSNAITSQRPAPQAVGDPEYAMDAASFTDNSIATFISSGTKYVFNTTGWVDQVRVYAPVLLDHVFNIKVLGGASGNELLYESSSTTIPEGAWSTLSIPTILITEGYSLTVLLETNYADGASGLLTYSVDSGFWASTQPSWAAASGVLKQGGVSIIGADTEGYGAEFSFQPATVATDWDVMAFSGGGSSGAGGGSGPTHTVSPVPPVDGEGQDGDIWFIPL